MIVIATILNTLVHLLLLVAMPPLLLGVINKTKAWFAGRIGPPMLAAVLRPASMLQKGMVISTTTTWVFRRARRGAGRDLLAGLLVPLGRFTRRCHFTGDLVLFAYLFALAKILHDRCGAGYGVAV